MENFDLEKLERKNIYHTPDNFLKDIQENVLSKTVHKPKTRVIKNNWWYASAAAIAMILAFSIFLPKNSKDIPQQNNTAYQNKNIENTPADIEIVKEKNNQKIATAIDDDDDFLPYDFYNDFPTEETNTTVKKAIDKSKKTSKNTAVNAMATNENNFESLMSGFSESDLAEVSKNSDQDLYLDLYN